ncbi:MAG: hypothetical protein ABSF71_36960 [Terriglobia bacterium]
MKTVYFATPGAVTNQKSLSWKGAILEDFGLTLILLTREEVITFLLRPENAHLLEDYLHIPVMAPGIDIDKLAARVRDASSQVSASWHRRTKGMPLIELRAEIVTEENSKASRVAELNDLISEMNRKGRIVLDAPAGSGKTTTLLQLADRHSSAGGVSILVELPQWLDGDSSILDFVSKTPAFRALLISPEELAFLGKELHFIFFINGWDEVGFDEFRVAGTRLKQLEQDFPKAGIILSTRVHQPSALPNMTLRARLLPVDRSQRNEYLRKRVGDRATALSKKLESDPVLDELTRTPLILAHVATLDEAKKDIPNTKMGILREVVQLIERAEDHRVALEGPPLSEMANVFLTDLAVWLTARGQTLIGQAEARAVIKDAETRNKIEADPAKILSELSAHHLLEPVGHPVSSFRFVHQQFQEFFAAEHLMRQLTRLVTGGSSADARTFVAAYLWPSAPHPTPAGRGTALAISAKSRLSSLAESTQRSAESAMEFLPCPRR